MVAITAFGLSSPTVVMMVKAILWKNGTTSIYVLVSMKCRFPVCTQTISDPMPPLKMLPPHEYTSCEMMQLI